MICRRVCIAVASKAITANYFLRCPSMTIVEHSELVSQSFTWFPLSRIGRAVSRQYCSSITVIRHLISGSFHLCIRSSDSSSRNGFIFGEMCRTYISSWQYWKASWPNCGKWRVDLKFRLIECKSLRTSEFPVSNFRVPVTSTWGSVARIYWVINCECSENRNQLPEQCSAVSCFGWERCS